MDSPAWQMIPDDIKNKLKDKRRRLTSGVLYKIKDKNGKIIPFIPNEHQKNFFREKLTHKRIIIPKARQIGYSTAEQIDDFDNAFWQKNWNVGIIADSESTALAIFRDKIMVLRENLPDFLKTTVDVKTERANELSFGHWSLIKVATSYRGGTLQQLHVSEFGKICNKYPEKAREIVTGSMEAVWVDWYITIESTAMGRNKFYEMCQEAKQIQDEGGEVWPFDFRLIFSPRRIEDSYRLDWDFPYPADMEQYFEKLKTEYGVKLDLQQKARYYSKRQRLQDDMKREYPSYFEEAFELAVMGNYYSREINIARQQHRVGDYQYNHQLPLYTVRDLGGSGWGDDTSVRFFQVYAGQVYFVDYREDNQLTRQERITTVQRMYEYVDRYIAPNDINANFTGKNRREMAQDLGVEFEVLPQSKSISDGIQQVKGLFPKFHFWPKTKIWLARLENYRRKRSDTMGCFLDHPMKDGNDHAADAMRYFAMRRHTEFGKKQTKVY